MKLWHVPFHLLGGGSKPSSEKDGESGHIPVLSIPTTTSPSSGSSSKVVWEAQEVPGSCGQKVEGPTWEDGDNAIHAYL